MIWLPLLLGSLPLCLQLTPMGVELLFLNRVIHATLVRFRFTFCFLTGYCAWGALHKRSGVRNLPITISQVLPLLLPPRLFSLLLCHYAGQEQAKERKPKFASTFRTCHITIPAPQQ
ncbi:hypothetical protein V8F06_001251 [Rhypophila decipiens]